MYSGSHSFALTRRGVENPAAVQLLLFLTAPEQQLLEARQGAVPVLQSVLQTVQAEATGAAQARWATLEAAMGDVLIPPKLARYPEVEEVLWKTVQAAMTGRISIDAALQQMTGQIHAIVQMRQLIGGQRLVAAVISRRSARDGGLPLGAFAALNVTGIFHDQ